MTLVILGLVILTLLVVLVQAIQINKLRHIASAIPADGGVLAAIKSLDDGVTDALAGVADLNPRVSALERRVPLAISRTGVISYDAFDNIAGNLSRSIALLSERGDGVVISLLVARDETRFFTKPIQGAVGLEPLSPEEDAAIAQAMAG